MDEIKELKEAYNTTAEKFFISRSKNIGVTGFQNREVEQPVMYSLVPNKLNKKKLLDLGCGPGIHLKEYSKRGAKCFGLDISEEMIKIAKKNCPKANLTVGSIYQMDYPNNYFDIVTASFVLDHVKEINTVVKEIRRVIKKGGTLTYSVPHPIIYMFRGSEKSKFIPSNNYFDTSPFYYDIAHGGKKFPEFPRLLEDYTNCFLNSGFKLIKFVENKPNKEWITKYSHLDQNLLKVPFLCFFKWRKE